MNRQALTAFAVLAALVASPAFAEGKPKMTMDMKAEKDIVVVENGKQIRKRVEAISQVAGETVIYSIAYRNEGDGVATGVKFDNKIPANTAYVADSAKGPGTEITFSIDDGKTYKQPAQLTYEVVNAQGRKETVKASPEKYTDIRWVIPQVPAGGSGSLSYEVRVK